MSIKIETGTNRTERYTGDPDVCFIGGVAYLPDNEASERYAAYAQRQGWTVTPDATTPDGWDDLVGLFRAQNVAELTRRVASILS